MKPLNVSLSSFLVMVLVVSSVFILTPNAVAIQPGTSDYTAYPEKGAPEFALKKGFMWKYPDGQFHGDKQITQGQFISSLVALRGVMETAPVPQLPESHWAKQTYERAQKAGILVDVVIDPNKLLTKEETAQLVFNAWKPYRGVKAKGFTYAGALITWGWMNPAPNGQPKFRGDLPVTRAEAAVILRHLWQDKFNLEQGEKYALEFHNSLKVVDGYLVGKVPIGDRLFFLNAQFFTKSNQVLGYKNGDSFKVKITDITGMTYTAMNQLDSSDAANYHYLKLPSLERKKYTHPFSD